MSSSRTGSWPSDRALALLLAALTVLLYEVSSIGHPTVFDYYSRLADAFVHGRLWLIDAPPYLVELVPCGSGGLCLHLPPLPALVVALFLPLFEPGTAQTLASSAAGGLTAAPTYLSVRRVGAPVRLALLVTVFAMAGTTLWFTASDGRAWYAAHAVGILFASLALLAALEGRPPWLVGVLLGAAVLSRYAYAAAAPGLALLLAQSRGERLWRVALGGALGLLPFALAEAGYNAARFGTPFETGYARLAYGDPFFEHGLFNPVYIPSHLYAILMRAPDFVDGTPFFLRPSRWGESVLLVSPAFAYAIAALGRLRARPEIPGLALAAALPIIVNVLHGTTGFTQFGYRYSLDPQPFLIPLVAIGAAWSQGGWRPPGWVLPSLVGWSVVANLYGVIAITHFGYW